MTYAIGIRVVVAMLICRDIMVEDWSGLRVEEIGIKVKTEFGLGSSIFIGD